MLHQPSLTGLGTTQLEALRLQVSLDFFDDITEEERDELGRFHNIVANCIPHSFVLASLFDVESMILEVPDHVLEGDPSFEWVTCPCCDGEKWLEVEGSSWTRALFSDPRRAFVYQNLDSSFKICGRCNGVGEVLDLATPGREIKTTATDPRMIRVSDLSTTVDTHPVLALAA